GRGGEEAEPLLAAGGAPAAGPTPAATAAEAEAAQADDRAREERYEEMYNDTLERLEKIIERLKALGSEASGTGAGLIAQAKSLAAMGQFADACDRLEAAHDPLADARWQAGAANPRAGTDPAR